ncbi:MAG: polyprenyl synthetase family protein [Ignavibacteriae bacterium]|nr:polyprenyl synthetase family protein [Ignavibacteriota bacterium]
MSSNDYKNLYNDYLNKVENKLDLIVKEKQPQSLYAPFHYLITGGGKRIRPVLTMICAGAVGGNPDDALDCGVAIELLHNFTLVHDDIMDRSPLRRNRQTVHEKWNEASAILTGDVMVGFAYNLLPTSNLHPRSNEIYKAFTRGLIEVCEGQAYDMDFNEKKDVTLDDYLNMIDKKTAKLLETSAMIGGYIGKGSDEVINSLLTYANCLGIAFQVQDDLLDLTAEQAELGKRIGQDLFEGKKTFLIIKALEKATKDEDKNLLKEFINNNGLKDENHLPQMVDLFTRLSVFEDAISFADSYFEKAKNSIANMKENLNTQMLHWLIESLNKRKK